MNSLLGKAKFIVILLGILVVAWAFITIYDNQANVELNPSAQSLSTPITGSFDLETINNLESSMDENLYVPVERFIEN